MILLLGKEDIGLELAIGGLRIGLIGCLDLLQRLVETPVGVGLRTLVDLFVVYHAGIGKMHFVFGFC